jgi:hypothetical protein
MTNSVREAVKKILIAFCLTTGLVTSQAAETWVAVGDPIVVHGDFNNFDFRIDASGAPIVAISENLSTKGIPRSNIQVIRWDGKDWQEIGVPFELRSRRSFGSMSMITGLNGEIYVTRAEEPVGVATNEKQTLLQLHIWEAGEWKLISRKQNRNSENSPHLAKNKNGQVVMCYLSGQVYVTKLVNKTWQEVGIGPVSRVNRYVSSCSVLVDEKENIIVVWRENKGSNLALVAKKWDGKNWNDLGGYLNFDVNRNAGDPVVSSLSDGSPIVAWEESAGNYNQIRVARWSTDKWLAVGGPVRSPNFADATLPSFIVDKEDVPTVTFYNPSGRRTYLAAFKEDSWQVQPLSQINTQVWTPQMLAISGESDIWSLQFGSDPYRRSLVMKKWQR